MSFTLASVSIFGYERSHLYLWCQRWHQECMIKSNTQRNLESHLWPLKHWKESILKMWSLRRQKYNWNGILCLLLNVEALARAHSQLFFCGHMKLQVSNSARTEKWKAKQREDGCDSTPTLLPRRFSSPTVDWGWCWPFQQRHNAVIVFTCCVISSSLAVCGPATIWQDYSFLRGKQLQFSNFWTEKNVD